MFHGELTFYIFTRCYCSLHGIIIILTPFYGAFVSSKRAFHLATDVEVTPYSLSLLVQRELVEISLPRMSQRQ